MNIWICNPYESLPVYGEARLRYASLSEHLLQQGHSVTLWSADWSHALKQRRFRPPEFKGAAEARNAKSQGQGTLNLELVAVPAYHKNVSLRRVWSHWSYAQSIASRSGACVEEFGKPDVILFSVPPMETGDVALKLGKKYAAKVVLDVMDAWPDTLRLAINGKLGSKASRDEEIESVADRTMSKAVKFLADMGLYPYSQMMRRYCREVDAVCAQSRAFVEHARSYGAVGDIPIFHLASEKKSDLHVIEDGASPDSSALRLAYLGSMGRVYDLQTVVLAVVQLRQEGYDLSLDLIGEGEQRSQLEAMVEQRGQNEAIRFHGYLNGQELEAVLVNAQVGIIPMHPGSGVAIPYKGPHYLSYGLYVINSLPGELNRMLGGYACGVSYQAGRVDSLAAAITEILAKKSEINSLRRNSIALFEDRFESARIHARMAEWILGIGSSG